MDRLVVSQSPGMAPVGIKRFASGGSLPVVTRNFVGLRATNPKCKLMSQALQGVEVVLLRLSAVNDLERRV